MLSNITEISIGIISANIDFSTDVLKTVFIIKGVKNKCIKIEICFGINSVDILNRTPIIII
jgi:hypothetical protein